jgi:hypothetical protein
MLTMWPQAEKYETNPRTKKQLWVGQAVPPANLQRPNRNYETNPRSKKQLWVGRAVSTANLRRPNRDYETNPRSESVLRQQFLHDIPRNIRQPEIAALEFIGQLRMIKAQ